MTISIQSHEIVLERSEYLLKDLFLVFSWRDANPHSLPPPGDSCVENGFPWITGIDIIWMIFWLHRLASTFGWHMFLNHLRIVRDNRSNNKNRLIMRVIYPQAPELTVSTISNRSSAAWMVGGVFPWTHRVWERDIIRCTLALLARRQILYPLILGPFLIGNRIRHTGNWRITAQFFLVVTIGPLDPT